MAEWPPRSVSEQVLLVLEIRVLGDLAISMVSPILGMGRLRGESRRDVSLRRPVVPALRQWPKQGDHDENDERLDQDRDIGAPGVLPDPLG